MHLKSLLGAQWRTVMVGQPEVGSLGQNRVGSNTLDYRSRNHGGEWQDMNYPVRLAWTACNYGGQRAWWLCPAVGCGRRVAVLYGGKVYASCRHCQKLAYRTQREAPDDRALRRVNTLLKQLGWVAGIAHGEGIKPKGMHWQTYDRMRMAYYAQSNKSFAGMSEKMGLAMGRLEGITALSMAPKI